MPARDAPVEARMLLGDAAPGRLEVALTLNACPGAFDKRIATALVESGIKATVFVTGLWLRENPAGLAFLLMHRNLFAIENHGELHIPPVLGHRASPAFPPPVVLPLCGATLPRGRRPSRPQLARPKARSTAIIVLLPDQ
jgi:hypothetical protein